MSKHVAPQKRAAIDAVAQEMRKLMRNLKLKTGRGFYALRHTFRTIADRSKDQPAIDHIMGHARGDMASVYREGIDDDRLQAVVTTVHEWLWPTKQEASDTPAPNPVQRRGPCGSSDRSSRDILCLRIPCISL